MKYLILRVVGQVRTSDISSFVPFDELPFVRFTLARYLQSSNIMQQSCNNVHSININIKWAPQLLLQHWDHLEYKAAKYAYVIIIDAWKPILS